MRLHVTRIAVLLMPLVGVNAQDAKATDTVTG